MAHSKLIKGVNDLATVRPDLLAEWDSKRNIFISPTSVTCDSKRNVWWKCSKGHEYKCSIKDRVLYSCDDIPKYCDTCYKEYLRNGYDENPHSIEIAALRLGVDVDDLREISYVAGGHRWEYSYNYDDWEYYDLIDDYLNDRII